MLIRRCFSSRMSVSLGISGGRRKMYSKGIIIGYWETVVLSPDLSITQDCVTWGRWIPESHSQLSILSWGFLRLTFTVMAIFASPLTGSTHILASFRNFVSDTETPTSTTTPGRLGTPRVCRIGPQPPSGCLGFPLPTGTFTPPYTSRQVLERRPYKSVIALIGWDEL